MSPLYTVIGLVVLAGLVVILLKTLQKDHINAFIQKRQPEAKVATRADYVEGAERIPVALSLTPNALYYENPDLQASFDISGIEEVEYSDDLATGKTIESHLKVLRLRSHGTAFEFLIDENEAKKWQTALPSTVPPPHSPAQVM